jgi:hypothetical protein
MSDDSQPKPISRTSHLSSFVFVEQYLYRTKDVIESLFVTLWVTQGEHSETYLEKSIQEWEQVVTNDSNDDSAQRWLRSFRDKLQWLRLERSIYGDSFLHMAGAAVATSIISIAHQGIRLGERQGNPLGDDRMVHSPYRLREFVGLSRDHGAHFWENPRKANPKRLEFQKVVLGYDQEVDGTNFNHSVTLLEKLGWGRYPDIENDLMNLFAPRGQQKTQSTPET